MGVNSKTKKALRGMARVVVQESAPDAGLRPGPWLGIPKDLMDEAVNLGFDPQTMLTFDESELEVLYEAWRALLDDPALEHLSSKEVQELLRVFAWRLTLARPGSKSGPVQRTIVDELVAELEAPISLYSVLYEIEYLQAPAEGLELGSVSIRIASQADLDEWCLESFGISSPPKVGSSIAVCRIEAGSPKVADQRARVLVDEALDVIRVSVANFGFRIWDNQLRFRRKPWFYAKQDSDDGVPFSSVSYSQNPHPLEFNGDALLDFSRNSLELLSVIWDKKTPQGLRDDMVKSMRWMGKSIVAFSADDKVTALCTALECLLSDRSAGLKSVDICRRAMVLGELAGEGFIHPSKVTHLYDRRSAVIHGSRFGICDESDYRTLLNMAIDVLRQVMLTLRDDPKITSKHKLFALLDDPERLKPCLKWCNEVDPQGLKPLIDDISRRICDGPDATRKTQTECGAPWVGIE